MWWIVLIVVVALVWGPEIYDGVKDYREHLRNKRAGRKYAKTGIVDLDQVECVEDIDWRRK